MSCSASPTHERAFSVSCGSPNTSTWPSVTRRRLQTALISVVLPAPFGPSSPKNAPEGIFRSKFSRASVPSSYRLVRPRSSSAGGSSRNTPSTLSTQLPAVVLLVVVPVLAGADRGPPVLVVAVPVDGPGEAVLEAHPRLPAELRAELVRAERVAAVVPGAVRHVLDQRLVAAGQLEDAVDHIDVLALVGAADVVRLARAAALQHRVDAAAEVLDIQPVAHLAAVAVDGQGVAMD